MLRSSHKHAQPQIGGERVKRSRRLSDAAKTTAANASAQKAARADPVPAAVKANRKNTDASSRQHALELRALQAEKDTLSCQLACKDEVHAAKLAQKDAEAEKNVLHAQLKAEQRVTTFLEAHTPRIAASTSNPSAGSDILSLPAFQAVAQHAAKVAQRVNPPQH